MNNLKSRNALPLMAALGIIALPMTASAVPITGEIGFGGTFAATGGPQDCNSPDPAPLNGCIAGATGIAIDAAFVLAATDDFAAAQGMTAVFNSFEFSPELSPAPLSLWSVSAGPVDYGFEMTSIDVDLQTSTQLNLTGSGVLMATGFDDTAGSWVFTGNSVGVFLTFSANSAPLSSVPEPGSLLLLGLGSIAMVGARRRPRRG